MNCRAPVAIAAICAASLGAAAPADGPSFAIRAGRVMPVADGPWMIRNGVVVVRDGKIEAVGGADMPVPPDLRLIELPDAVVMPGLVAAASDLAGAHRGDRSIGAGFRAIDAFDRYADHRRTVASGVTTAHLDPGAHRLLSGQGAVVKLAGPHDDRVLEASADLSVNLGPAVYGPPNIVEYAFPPSPDQEILPSVPQRPSSRLAQFLALKEAIEASAEPGDDWHATAMRDAWERGVPLRIRAQRAADLTGAITFLARRPRTAYLVGGAEAARVADVVRESGLPLVYTIPRGFAVPAGNVGADDDAYTPRVEDLARLDGVELALAVSPGEPLDRLRLAAATARRAGLDEERVIRAITEVPARILGVGDRVGSLRPGLDADLLVLTDHPLATSSHVQRVYVDGRLTYTTPESGAVVVRAGTVWLGPDEWLENGEVLVQDGRIAAVGKRVPQPPHAQVIDAGPDGFVAPGFIDALGHLGLEGDRGGLAADVTPARLVGAPGPAERRVAQAGVTTVMTAAYSLGSGSQIAAIKTAGRGRSDRVVSPTAAVAFELGTTDPVAIEGALKGRIDAGKKYLEKWTKYYAELEEWEKKKEEGTLEEAKPETEEEVTEESRPDPISGTWEITLTGDILPEPATGRVGLKLDGETFEGRVLDPPPPVDHRIVGTLSGNTIKGEIEIDTGGMGKPEFEGTLDREDHGVGTLSVAGMLTLDFEMTRTDRTAAEFKVVRKRRTRGEGGRPLPPKVEEALEPLRAWLEKKIPAVIAVTDARQVDAVLAYLVEKEELPIVLLGAPGAGQHADRLREKGVGVVLPREIVRRERDAWYHQGDDLSRHGVSVAFQSGAEDGARSLPLVGLHAVERGLSPEAALAALTIDAARMYHVDERVGTIAPGRDGDLLIYSGHPFDAGSTLERVIVNGREVQR